MTASSSDDKRARQPGSPAGSGGVASAEQAMLAGGVAVCLLGMAGWFLLAGGGRGGLVPHDAPPRRTTGFRIDPNTASRAELMQLPGIGPTTADRILERRRIDGPFDSIEAMIDVPGIGEVTLERIRPFVRVQRARREPETPDPAPEPPRDVRTGEPVHARR
jgi:competence protein ComEA